MNNIESLGLIIEGLWQDPVASFFIWFIAIWFVLAFLALITGIRPKIVAITPSALSTIGIIGTFVGILLGLAKFNPNQIDESVPFLIDGMKLAFGTSIAGISTSLIFKAFVVLLSGSGRSDNQVTPGDILKELQNINKSSSLAATQNKNALEELRNVISSENDSSLMTQLQKLRTTLSDGQNELIKEFKEFATNMAENNQKALIEALESVIRDFNEKLTEQFGENFKQLNQAVEKLVIWQEEYRKLLEVYQERLEAAIKALESTQVAVLAIEEASAKIPEAVEKLDPATRMLIDQLEILQESLISIKTLRERTDEAYPVIEDNLARITNGFSDNVTELLTKSDEALERSEKSFSAMNDGYQTILTNVQDSQSNFSNVVGETATKLTELANEQFTKQGEVIETSATKLTELANEQFTKHGEIIETSATKLADLAEAQFTKNLTMIENAVAQSDQAIRDAWTETSNKISSQFENFDKETQEELQRVLEQLGGSLASVSEKFVSDYEPLTEKLRDLVEISKRVE